MDAETKRRALELALNWRARASNCEIKYRDMDPNATQIAVAALEGCAQELEDLCKELSSGLGS